MLNESMLEILLAAHNCIAFDKRRVIGWTAGSQGCLGYPAAILLFSLVDAIGSYYEGTSITFPDGSTTLIQYPSHHFYVLDAAHFDLSLTKDEITSIYSAYRCLLTHNNVLASGHSIDIGSESDQPFLTNVDESDKAFVERVNLLPFLTLCTSAVESFLKVVPTLTPGSIQETKITDKKKEAVSPSSTSSPSLSGMAY
jgi:hypothetical protein